MKNFILPILLSGTLFSCKPKTFVTLDAFNLKGKVKMTVETPHSAVLLTGSQWGKSPAVLEGQYINVFNFDEEGQEQSYVMMDAEQKVVSKYIPGYNDKGIQTSGQSFNGDGKLQANVTINKYSPKGMSLEATALDADGKLQYKTVTEIDAQERRTHMKAVKENNERIFEEWISYDEKGNVLKHTMLWHDDPEKRVTTNQYLKFDEKGNWTERLEMGKDAPVLWERVITYY